MEGRMKRKKINMLLAVLALLLCLQGCTAPSTGTDKGGSTAEAAPPSTDRDEKTTGTAPDQLEPDILYPYVTDVDESILTTGLDPAYLVLANKDHPLDADYAPSDMAPISDVYTHYQEDLEMESHAAAALEAMIEEMYAVGVRDVMVTSAYRSYSYQQQVYNGHLQKEQTAFTQEAYLCLGEDYILQKYFDEDGKIIGIGLDYVDARTVVASYSALPGQSEHQTGLCVDLITSDMKDKLTVDFENKAAFAYLSENAHKFGFILRYPKGKEEITGYVYEPWHYRFVGREVATEIYRSGLTLEEYLQQQTP